MNIVKEDCPPSQMQFGTEESVESKQARAKTPVAKFTRHRKFSSGYNRAQKRRDESSHQNSHFPGNEGTLARDSV